MQIKWLVIPLLCMLIVMSRCKKENTDTIQCDTTGWVADSIRYSNTVAPILDQYCTSCHNNSTHKGGVNLTGYANAKKYASNDKLLGTMGYLDGFKGMPEDGKLSQDKICKVKFWVDNGAINN